MDEQTTPVHHGLSVNKLVAYTTRGWMAVKSQDRDHLCRSECTCYDRAKVLRYYMVALKRQGVTDQKQLEDELKKMDEFFCQQRGITFLHLCTKDAQKAPEEAPV